MREGIQQSIDKAGDIFEKPANIILALSSVIVLVFGTIFKYLYVPWYIMQCQEFYGIPAKYFKQIDIESIYGNFLLVFILLLAIIISLWVGRLMEKKTDIIQNVVSHTIHAALGILIMFMNYSYFMNITLERLSRCIGIEFVSLHVKELPFIFLSLSFFMGVIFIFTSFVGKKPFWIIVRYIIICGTSVIAIISAYYSLPIAPQEKFQYEVTYVEDDNGNGDNRVILAEVDGKYLTVSYGLQDGSDKTIFYTNSYKMMPMEGTEVWVSRFNQGIEINNNNIIID